MKTAQSYISKEKRAIAFWGAGVFPDDHGSKGIPVFAEMLRMLSFQYDIIVYSHLRLKKEFLPGIKVRQTPAWCGKRVAYFLLFFAFLIDHAKRSFSLLQAHSSHPDPLVVTLLKKIFRIPAVVGYNAGEFVYLDDIDFGDLKSRKGKINRWVINHCDRVTAVSFFHAATIAPYMRNASKLRVIYRGVLADQFAYREKEFGKTLKIIQVAYHHPVKDQVTLLNAFARLVKQTPAHLHIIGPDFWNNTIQQAVSQRALNPHVTIHGALPYSEIAAILSQSDIMVHTAKYDALAVSVIEAMSCGVVNVGTRVGVLSDLEGQCCIAVAPGDVEGLVEGMIQLINSPSQVMSLRRNARRWVEQHDITAMVEAYSKLYEELIHEN